jgi:acyl-CoA thioester hydrolase
MYEYTRQVYYYETDLMGIVHHSKHVKWLEEARLSYFDEVDLAYIETMSYGVMSPVTDINLVFKHPVKYGDIITVQLQMTKYTGVRFRIKYTVINQDGELLLEVESGHAFIDKTGKPVSLSRIIPHRHEMLKKLIG